MMMRIAHFADAHLSNRQTIAGRFILQDGVSLALLDRVKALNKICEYVETKNIDLTIVAGDLFDNANPENIAIRAAVQTIERLVEIAPVILIRGNHDGKNATSSALAPFGKIARRNGIYVFEQHESFSLTIKNTKVNLFLLPYPRRSDFKENQELKFASPEDITIHISHKMEEILSGFSTMIEHDAINILVGHFTAVGGLYSKEQNIPIFDINVRREFLEPFDLTCLGHLHTPQPLYSGSIARNGFGEQDQRVGFKVYDIQLRRKPVEQFIELPAREYITLSPEDFINNGNINPEAAVRIKGKVPKYQYDELVRRMKTLNHPFLKNALEVELETAGSNDGQDMSEEPDVEAALRIWAEGRNGMDKFIDMLVIKGKEIETKIMEGI